MNQKAADLLLALGAFVIAFAMWQFSPLSPVVYPLRLFVTFIHELGHGVAAILTGGRWLEFEVQSTGAGLAYTSGGYRPIISSAGYVGTAVFGASLLYTANHSHNPRRIAMGLGLGFTLLTLLFSGFGLGNFNILEAGVVIVLGGAALALFLRAQTSGMKWGAAGVGTLAGLLLLYFAAGDHLLTLVVGVISGVLLVALGYYGKREVVLFTLNFLAFITGLNAVTDAWVLFKIVTVSDRVPSNDASTMANVTIMPAWFWAGTWITLAVFLLGLAVWFALIRPMRYSDGSSGKLSL